MRKVVIGGGSISHEPAMVPWYPPTCLLSACLCAVHVCLTVQDCPVEAVTVYSDRAGGARVVSPSSLSFCVIARDLLPSMSLLHPEVTRTVLVEDAVPGLYELSIPKLSQWINGDSIRVKGTGKATILEVAENSRNGAVAVCVSFCCCRWQWRVVRCA